MMNFFFARCFARAASRSRRLSLLAPLALVAACGGSSADIGDPTLDPATSDAAAPGDTTGDPGDPGDPGSKDAGTDASDPGVAGPQVAIALRGSTTPVTHVDAFSGETPGSQIVAIRSLVLLRSPTDPSPLVVFDLGAASKEVDLVSGVKTTIATVPLASLSAGTFTSAKVGIAYVRYEVAARMHAGISTVDGAYDNVQSLSDGAVIDGVKHDKGWFRYAFGAGGMTYGALEGENAPVPALSGAGGITLDTTGPVSYYVFPVNLTIDPTSDKDWEALMEANVHESFRWQDQATLGYTTGVFDTTPSTFEPVMSFGANAFAVTYTAK